VKKIKVNLGERSLNILVGNGLLNDLGKHVSDVFAGKKCMLVSDANVMRLHGKKAVESLESEGMQVSTFVVEPTENSKSLDTVGKMVLEMKERGLNRNSLVLALGGGVVGDLAGFCASIYMRGIPVVQIPTTLLAQVDSGIGGKTAVNHAGVKNIIGAFWQPKLVISDVSILSTLSERIFREGTAEAIKYAFISDPSLLEKTRLFSENNPESIEELVSTASRIKAEFVSKDERDEKGLRAALNFGHTMGHAVEANTSLLHGESVAVGMAFAARVSQKMGLLEERDAKTVVEKISHLGLPTEIPAELKWEDLLPKMNADKKTTDAGINVVLLEGLGKPVVKTVSESVLKEVFDESRIKAN
jgi:3-dehydroquinate synthase